MREGEHAEDIETIDQYIAAQPADVRGKLAALSTAIRHAAPQAAEKITYRMPTWFLHGNLVHFAAYRNHIGFYPAPSGIAAFQQELARYRSAKGSVQFPIDEALPLDLIARIVRFRVQENMQKYEQKLAKKSAARRRKID